MKLLTKQIPIALLLSLMVGGVLFVISLPSWGLIPNLFAPLLDRANHGIQQILIQTFHPSDRANSRIVVVEIDDRSLSQTGGLGRFSGWRRSSYATVIDRLTQAGAATIGVDILFLDPSDPSEDQILTRSLHSHSGVVIGFSLASPALFPTPLIGSGIAQGFVNPGVTGTIIDHLNPLVSIDGVSYEAFSLAVVRAFLDRTYQTETRISEQTSEVGYRFHTPPYEILPYSLASEKNFLIQFLMSYQEYTRISFVDIIR